MLKKLAATVFILIVLASLCKPNVLAADYQEEYLKAQVKEVLDQGEKPAGPDRSYDFQKIKVEVLEGEVQGQHLELEYGGSFDLKSSQKVKKGDVLVLNKQTDEQGNQQYFVIDRWRLGNLMFIFFLFFLTVVLVGSWQGFTSILGMLLSLLIILKFLIPQILAGANPLLVSIAASLIILISTIYLAHGFNPQTHLAIVSTSICLIITGLLSWLFVSMARLTGLGSEEAYSLTLGQTANINFKGLLLGGIIIGALGSLDDVTTSQTASLFQLHQVSPKIAFEELFSRGIKIGKEHVAAMVNTLILAYAGASLALFLLFYIGAQDKPLWMIINSQVIAEEIVRSLSGSIGLVLAVPITSLLTCYWLKYGWPKTKKKH